MKFSNIFLGVFLLYPFHVSYAFQPNGSRGIPSSGSLSVTQQNFVEEPKTKDDDEKKAVPYVISRGDGSTGGGGLPMPKAEKDDGLKRPKVGAEMPKG